MLLAVISLVLACGTASAPAESIDDRDVGPEHPLPASYVPADLVEIGVPPATRRGLRLRAPAWEALSSLLEAAREAGLELRVVSAYRSFAYQRSVYERAVERHGAEQRWVARPGESEHQLGTTVDLADGDLRHVLVPSFGDAPEGRWLAKNCDRFGFRLTFTEATADSLGIRPEPWHVRFLGVPDEHP